MRFYEPTEFRSQHKSNRQASTATTINPDLNVEYKSLVPVSPYYASEAVRTHNLKGLSLYESLVSAGVCREQARGVLPQNLYTQYYGTVNLHNLLKFVSLRIHEGAQWEIQRVAEACLQIAEQYFPQSVEAYKNKKEMEN